MNLKKLKDDELLFDTKNLVQNEREVLTQILHHLREVERRKLFSELGYQSLFEYAVKELKYSEGQASRRNGAMRLLKELPQLEEKIESGKLSLSNLSQAQSYFRETQKVSVQRKLLPQEKLEVLERLENKSAREGQRVLLKLQPQKVLPKERERVLDEGNTELRFILTEDMRDQLDELRSLVGPKALEMNFGELVEYMTGLSIETLRAKKFGKKRSQSQSTRTSTPTSAKQSVKAIHPQVWSRDRGKCVKCGSQRNLNIDHIKPKALGGENSPENLRLLCFHCNQRAAIKVFGLDYMISKQTTVGRGHLPRGSWDRLPNPVT